MTSEFAAWYASLSQHDQDALDVDIKALKLFGPVLGRPRIDTVHGSRHPNMKELRTGTLRSLLAFDPHRTAILLIGGDKRGKSRFYERIVWIADRLYDAHLDDVRRGGPTE